MWCPTNASTKPRQWRCFYGVQVASGGSFVLGGTWAPPGRFLGQAFSGRRTVHTAAKPCTGGRAPLGAIWDLSSFLFGDLGSNDCECFLRHHRDFEHYRMQYLVIRNRAAWTRDASTPRSVFLRVWRLAVLSYSFEKFLGLQNARPGRPVAYIVSKHGYPRSSLFWAGWRPERGARNGNSGSTDWTNTADRCPEGQWQASGLGIVSVGRTPS